MITFPMARTDLLAHCQAMAPLYQTKQNNIPSLAALYLYIASLLAASTQEIYSVSLDDIAALNLFMDPAPPLTQTPDPPPDPFTPPAPKEAP
jgi:streptomycin 6-kinase